MRVVHCVLKVLVVQGLVRAFWFMQPLGRGA